jgi:hypothetical protein
VSSSEYTEWAALELLEMPEPYRSDLRFAFLITQVGGWLGIKPQPRLDKVYEQMRQLFDRTSEEAAQGAGMELNLKSALRGISKSLKKRQSK